MFYFSFVKKLSNVLFLVRDKVVHMVAHSIPGSILQTYAFLISDQVPAIGQIVSILSSVLTIAYCSAILSYDKDVDVDCKAAVPAFYASQKKGSSFDRLRHSSYLSFYLYLPPSFVLHRDILRTIEETSCWLLLPCTSLLAAMSR